MGRIAAPLLIACGLAAIAAALAADDADLGGSTAFGWKQQLALLGGVAAVGTGIVLMRRTIGRQLAAWRNWWGVAVVTLAAAVLRFATIDAQSLWSDEIVTRLVLNQPFDDAMSAVADRNTPFLFYLVGWPWTRVFGLDEFGLRSLSAFLGAATVPVVYAAAKELISRRAAMLAGVMTAASPLLVWYSQEARTYAMLAFFAALSFLFFARALDTPKNGNLALWAVASALALMTHYFAVFLIVPEGIWLFAAAGRPRAVVAASAALTACGLALLPLAVHQEQLGLEWVSMSAPLLERLQSTAEALVVFGVMVTASVTRPLPPLSYLGVVGAALVVVAIWLTAFRATSRERRGIVCAASIAAATVLLPLALALLGKDYLLPRNLIGAWVPLAVALAGAFTVRGSGRLGIAGGVAACAVALTVTLVVMFTPKYHRDDWREAAAAVGPVTATRAVLLQPRGNRATSKISLRLPESGTAPRVATPLDYYRSFDATGYPISGAAVREIVLVDFRTFVFEREDQPLDPQPPAGFRLVQADELGTFWLFRLRADVPRPVSAEKLLRVPADDASGEANRPPMLYLEHPPAS